jgi:hypothetical protein
MGWFDRLTGRGTPAQEPADERERFARLVMDALRKKGEKRPIEYDANGFKLQIPPDSVAYLENAFNAYRQAKDSDRSSVLERFVSVFANTGKDDVPARFEDALPNLYPRVHERAWSELLALEMRIQGRPIPVMPSRPLGGELRVGLALDRGQSWSEVRQEELERWKVDFESALDAAIERLPKKRLAPFEMIAPGIFLSMAPDTNAPARLFALDTIRKLELVGDPVAIVPNQEVIAVVGSRDTKALELLARWCMTTLDKARHMSFEPLRLDGDRWQSYTPDVTPEIAERYRGLARVSRHDYYRYQKQSLEKLPENKDVFVASYTAGMNEKTGEITESRCVWGELDQLLPRTERVGFVAWDKAKNQPNPLCEAPWDRVQAALGEFLEPTNLYPERFRVKRFPTRAQLEALDPKWINRPADRVQSLGWSTEELRGMAARVGGGPGSDRKWPGVLEVAVEEFRPASLDESLPFNPYEDAQVGDWCLTGVSAPEKRFGEWMVMWQKVVAVRDDRVEVAGHVQNGFLALPPGPTRVYSRKERPRLGDLVPRDGLSAGTLRVAQGSFTLEGRKFTGLVCKFEEERDGKKTDQTRYLSSEVRGSGCLDERLLGFGRAGNLDWGVRALASVFEWWAGATSEDLKLNLGLKS